MLRMLALPVAVIAALAASACASGGAQDAESADTAAQQAPASEAGSAQESSAEGGTEQTAEQSAEGEGGSPAPSGSGWDSPEALDAPDASMRRDPGVPGLAGASGASIDDVLRLGAVASWIEPGERIALSLPASEACWAFVAEPVAESPTRIIVQAEQPEPCASPDAARTYAVEVPEGVDASAGLELVVEGLEHHFTLTLPQA